MPHKKPVPVIDRPARPLCPVCGETSYSLAGIHPQCVVKQADARRLGILKTVAEPEGDSHPATLAKPWQKACPKCHSLQHVRKKICDCGFELQARTRLKSEESQPS